MRKGQAPLLYLPTHRTTSNLIIKSKMQKLPPDLPGTLLYLGDPVERKPPLPGGFFCTTNVGGVFDMVENRTVDLRYFGIRFWRLDWLRSSEGGWPHTPARCWVDLSHPGFCFGDVNRNHFSYYILIIFETGCRHNASSSCGVGPTLGFVDNQDWAILCC